MKEGQAVRVVGEVWGARGTAEGIGRQAPASCRLWTQVGRWAGCRLWAQLPKKDRCAYDTASLWLLQCWVFSFCNGVSSPCNPPLPVALQPVVGDWRQRVKQPTKGAKKRQQQEGSAAATAGAAAAAAAAAAPAGTQSSAPAAAGASTVGPAPGGSDAAMPDLDALSEGLPPGWRAMWDKTHRRVYFGNLDTQASWGRGPGRKDGRVTCVS